MANEVNAQPPEGRESTSLYAGIRLFYADTAAGLPFPDREIPDHTLRIDYCRAGRMVWRRKNGGSISFEAGDFALHTADALADISFLYPAGPCRGLTISVDLREVSAHPPAPVADTAVFRETLERLCRRGGMRLFFAGGEQTESIFSGFYGQPEKLRLAYQRIKVLELFLCLSRTLSEDQLSEYPSETIEIVREVHDRLLRNMERRITIEELSRQYHINPTTLKAAFKAVYRTSLAAHMKEHRMETAARLLRETDMQISGIARAVGYDSQSKFTAAFKSHFQVLPRDYRRHMC